MSIFNISKSLIILFLVMSVALSGCFVAENPYSGLAPGYWRAVLTLDAAAASAAQGGGAVDDIPNRIDAINTGELPFNFEVKYDDAATFYIEIINGKERIRVDDIAIGFNKRIAKDTILINFPVFDSYIRGVYYENIIEGEWVVNNREGDYRVPFVARQGLAHRFTKMRDTPDADLSGRWEVVFENDTPGAYNAGGEFAQQGNNLTGTFLTETGDHRFLAGTVQGSKVYLSAFDGSHAFLYEARIQSDGTLFGTFWSGTHYKTTWTARRNTEFTLGDADSLTFLKPGFDRFDFAFPNADEQIIALGDPRYEGKVKIVQILGTWCPNCRDETEFLLDYLRKNRHEDLAVIGLAFERHRDPERARSAIRKYREHFGMDYEILLAGHSDKDKASEALPMLNRVLSYPTMIFLDRQNNVRRIHTGFSGPATSAYEPFRRDFESFIQKLLAEAL